MYNKAIMQGYVASDPKITTKDVDGEVKMSATYAFGVPRDFDRSKSDFFHCVVFGDKGVEFVRKYVKKGMMFLIDGRFQTGEYLDSTGQKIKSVSMVVNKHQFCGAKQETNTTDKDGFFPEPENFPSDTEPDDLNC